MPIRKIARIPLAAYLLLIALPFTEAAAANIGTATGPWVVDSAEYMPRNTAEISLWHASQRTTGVSANHAELGLRPARNWQFAIEVATIRPLETTRVSRTNLQAKSLWRELFHDGYGAGMVVDIGYNSSEDRVDAGRLTAPLTIEPLPDRVTLHANIAADYLRDHDDELAAAWAAGTNIRLHPRTELIGEVFGEDRGERPSVQSGLRLWFGDQELSLDVTWGRVLESGARDIWTIGVSLHRVRF